MESLLIYMGKYMFHVFGIIAIAGAIGTIFSKNAIHSVVCFLLTMLAMSGCYICLSAEFLAVAQLLIYAGGIVVLFLFVIMLVEMTKYKESRLFQRQTPYVSLMIVISTIVIISTLWRTWFNSGADSTITLNQPLYQGLDLATQNAQIASRSVFSGYILPFEILSVTLLVALVGAVVLAKKDTV